MKKHKGEKAMIYLTGATETSGVSNRIVSRNKLT